MSSLDDARRQLKSLTFIASGSLKEISSKDGVVSFRWLKKRRVSDDMDYLVTKNGTVTSIMIKADPPNDLKTMTESLGPPTKMLRISRSEEISDILDLYYPRLGLDLSATRVTSDQFGSSDCVNPAVTASQIAYYVADSSVEQTKYWSSVFDGHQDLFLARLQNWAGLCTP